MQRARLLVAACVMTTVFASGCPDPDKPFSQVRVCPNVTGGSTDCLDGSCEFTLKLAGSTGALGQGVSFRKDRLAGGENCILRDLNETHTLREFKGMTPSLRVKVDTDRCTSNCQASCAIDTDGAAISGAVLKFEAKCDLQHSEAGDTQNAVQAARISALADGGTQGTQGEQRDAKRVTPAPSMLGRDASGGSQGGGDLVRPTH